MRTEIQKLLTLKKYYKSLQITKDKLILDLQKPSKILIQNIHDSWLRSIYGKTVQHFPVYLNDDISKNQKPYYGSINKYSSDIDNINFEQINDTFAVKNNVELILNLNVPQQDIMQYFVQWQRYRKYWWSSITTTPSLFSVNDMQHENERSNVNIIANFKWGQHIVETISVNGQTAETFDNVNQKNHKTACLTCNMGLETALVTLLLDGVSNATREEYLRLHNKMAPYKISFALDSKEPTVLDTLKDLASLLFDKLKSKEISAWIPCFSQSMDSQVKENLHLGVTYTAILDETTLSIGIFHLLNSSTMLKEQVHVADFASYASLLCKK